MGLSKLVVVDFHAFQVLQASQVYPVVRVSDASNERIHCLPRVVQSDDGEVTRCGNEGGKMQLNSELLVLSGSGKVPSQACAASRSAPLCLKRARMLLRLPESTFT